MLPPEPKIDHFCPSVSTLRAQSLQLIEQFEILARVEGSVSRNYNYKGEVTAPPTTVFNDNLPAWTKTGGIAGHVCEVASLSHSGDECATPLRCYYETA